MLVDEVRFAALALVLFGNAAQATQHCKYTICETELDKPMKCTTRESDLEPSEMAELFFSPEHPVESYDCKPIPREKKK